MNKNLINYLLVVAGLMAVVVLGLDLPAGVASRTLLYASVPAMVALGTLYIVIEHGISRMKNNNESMINMPAQEDVHLAKSA